MLPSPTNYNQTVVELSKLNEMKRTKQSLDDAKNADLSHLCFCFFSVCRLDTAHHSEPSNLANNLATRTESPQLTLQLFVLLLLANRCIVLLYIVIMSELVLERVCSIGASSVYGTL